MTFVSDPPALAPPERMVAHLREIFRRGSTSPALVETASGARYLLKFAGAGQGPRGLLTEFVATRMAGYVGVRVPAVMPLYLPRDFPWQVGTDEYDDMVRRSAGWNLGIQYLDGAREIQHAELGRLPDAFADRVVVADRLVQNMDRSERNPNILWAADGAPWAIDYGACLICERVIAGSRFTFDISANHFLRPRRAASAMIDPVPLPTDAELDAWLAEVPDAWLADAGRDRETMRRGLRQYLDAFARTFRR